MKTLALPDSPVFLADREVSRAAALAMIELGVVKALKVRSDQTDLIVYRRNEKHLPAPDEGMVWVVWEGRRGTWEYPEDLVP